MRAGYDCMLVSDRPFGVSNCILSLAHALLATREADDELLFYVRASVAELPGASQANSPRFARTRLGRILWEQVALPGRATRDGIRVFHAPGYVMPLRMRVPTVLTVYDLLALTHPEYCKRANRHHYGLVLPRSIHRAHRIIACSRTVRRQILERFGLEEERVVVVRPGVDDLFRAPCSTEELADARRRYRLVAPFVLFVGNPEPKKNLPRLLAAFRIARERGHLDGELVVTGGGGWGDVLRDHAHTPGLRHLPYVPRADLRALLQLARLLAFPSLAEGFGLPVVEAMASRLPVVCSNVPAVEESDPAAVVCVDPEDVESIANGMTRLWSDDALRAEAIDRGALAAATFTWERAARETWRLYRELGSR